MAEDRRSGVAESWLIPASTKVAPQGQDKPRKPDAE
jgi:hypothetical protein